MNLRVAILCMQKNEGELLNVWIEYHALLFGYDSLFLIDNGSTDSVTLGILKLAIEKGATVINASSQEDFEKKGVLISKIISENQSNFDWFIPLDCDELMGIIDEKNNFISEKNSLMEELFRLGQIGKPLGKVTKYLWNIPHTSLAYYGEIKKVILNRYSDVVLDTGFHLYDYQTGKYTVNEKLFEESKIGYIHFHNKDYVRLIASSREKLKLRVSDFKRNTIIKHKGKGEHLVKNFLMTPDEYQKSFPQGTFSLIPLFEKLGMPIPFSDSYQTISPDLLRQVLSPVNIQYYYNKIVATQNEINLIYDTMFNAQSYVEFGAGGTTKLACEAGIQQIDSIETDVDFCETIIERHDLRKFIDTNRLKIHHVNIGQTREWGYPIILPSENQINAYLGKAVLAESADVVLIDGRYRVACGATIYKHLKQGKKLLIHDYFSRKNYKVLEEIFNLEQQVDDLAIFTIIPGREDIADRIRKEYFWDAS